MSDYVLLSVYEPEEITELEINHRDERVSLSTVSGSAKLLLGSWCKTGAINLI
jgi:hypothetical protein